MGYNVCNVIGGYDRWREQVSSSSSAKAT
jgi:hypothetical protein